MDKESLNLASLLSDPDVFKVLQQTVGIRYTTTQPTHTPNKEVEAWVYYDSSNYWLYLYANGAWRSRMLLSAGTSDVTKIIAGTGISLSPSAGTGDVTVTNTLTVPTIKEYVTASTVTVNNTTTETNIFTFTLPANTLSTNNVVRIKVNAGFGTTTTFRNGSDTLTIQLYYSSSSLSFPIVITGSSVGSYGLVIEASIIAKGATNSQQVLISAFLFRQGQFSIDNQTFYLLDSEAFAVDSTSAQTLKMTAKWSFADSANRVVFDSTVIDLVS